MKEEYINYDEEAYLKLINKIIYVGEERNTREIVKQNLYLERN